jgi:hypothetical protein
MSEEGHYAGCKLPDHHGLLALLHDCHEMVNQMLQDLQACRRVDILAGDIHLHCECEGSHESMMYRSSSQQRVSNLPGMIAPLEVLQTRLDFIDASWISLIGGGVQLSDQCVSL